MYWNFVEPSLLKVVLPAPGQAHSTSLVVLPLERLSGRATDKNSNTLIQNDPHKYMHYSALCYIMKYLRQATYEIKGTIYTYDSRGSFGGGLLTDKP